MCCHGNKAVQEDEEEDHSFLTAEWRLRRQRHAIVLKVQAVSSGLSVEEGSPQATFTANTSRRQVS